MVERAASPPASAGVPGRAAPDRVTLERLIALRGAGESLKLATPRVQAVGAGGHLSAFKGRGVEFDESRPYQPGDDPRTMDWRVTARTGRPHTKVFREERNRPVLVWLDLRMSMMFGTRRAFKAVCAAEASALIAWSAIANGDRLGGLVSGERVHHELRPRLGRRAALTWLQRVADDAFWPVSGALSGARAPAGAASRAAGASPESPGALDAAGALERLVRVTRPGSLVFLLSDFHDLGTDAERHLRKLGAHGDVFMLHVFDPIEAELPPPGRYRIVVGGRSTAIDTSDPALRQRYRERFAARREQLAALERVPGVSVLDCATDDDPRDVLARRFRTGGGRR